MKFFVQFAQKVVNAASDILPFPISLSDEEGNIIGSTIPEQIGTIHSPSKEVIQFDRSFLKKNGLKIWIMFFQALLFH